MMICSVSEIKRVAVLAGLVATVLSWGLSQSFADTPPAPLTPQTRKAIFDRVWSRINERFFDPTFHGVDWKQAKLHYEPLAQGARTDEAFYAVLEQMLDELKQSHIGIIPPEAYADDEKATGSEGKAEGSAGIIVQWIEDKPVISHVDAGSGAEAAGIRPGFVLTAIGERSADDIVARFRKRVKKPEEVRTLVRLQMGELCDGPVGTEIKIGYLDADDKPQIANVKRTPLAGKTVTFGALPPMRVEVNTRKLPGGYGYISANIFLMPILEPIRAAVKEFVKAPGIILDLRGNPGGIGFLANGIAGSFYSKDTNLGTMKMRQGNINFLARPWLPLYSGPLVILTDEGSVSTSEVLAGGMQENKRAVIVGEATAGMVLPSVVEVLPGGARFQYAFADFKTPKGVLLEGRGVLPDIPVRLTRRALLDGHDPVLDAALVYLNSKQGAKKNP